MGHIVSLVVVLIVVTITTKALSKKRMCRICNYFLWIMFAVYIAVWLYFALFSREIGGEGRFDLKPFQTYIHLFGDTEAAERFATNFTIIGLEATSPWVGITLNILLYYPLGYLLPILFPKIKPKHVILIGCLCSIATEATQYILKMGWCETDDVIHNTLGTVIGVGIWLWQSKRLNAQRSAKSEKGET